ncbi:MAG: GspH/FimT family pseudopilin [Steroidobacteraceae bacterium]
MKKAHPLFSNPLRQRGFTIIELMITLALVSVLASIALPSVRTYVLNSRINSTTQDLYRSLQTARSEAIKRQSDVVICATNDPTAASPVCNRFGTPQGWIVFADTNSDWQHAATEALIEVRSFDSSKIALLINNGRRFKYLATGFFAVDGSTASQARSTAVVICDSRGNTDTSGGSAEMNSAARGIVIGNTGRTRITKVRDTTADTSDIADLLNVIGASCPT